MIKEKDARVGLRYDPHLRISHVHTPERTAVHGIINTAMNRMNGSGGQCQFEFPAKRFLNLTPPLSSSSFVDLFHVYYS